MATADPFFPGPWRPTAWRRFSLPWTVSPEPREGFLVRWSCFQTSPPQEVWAEASPLPGWSRETAQEVAAWLRAQVGQDMSDQLLPAALAWSRSAAAARHRLTSETLGAVSCAALLSGPCTTWIPRAEAAWAAGARTFKLKLSPTEVTAARHFLRWLEKVSAGGAEPPPRVRLDSNRRFALAEALASAKVLHHPLVAFWEEPVADPEAWPRLLQECPIPLALDETLREISPAELSRYAGVAALVLKPTLLGGAERWLPFIAQGRALGMGVVFSAAYESGVGMSDLVRWAAQYSEGEAAGLDTYASLPADVLQERLDFSSYQLVPAKLPEATPAAWHPLEHPVWTESWEDG